MNCKYTKLDHTVKGLIATLNNMTWPDGPPLQPKACPEFVIRRRGNCNPQGYDSYACFVNDGSTVDKATDRFKYTGELVFRAEVLTWPNLIVQFDCSAWELPKGYYEGFFRMGCSETCRLWFVVGQQLCFTACPQIDESSLCMPYDPNCGSKETDRGCDVTGPCTSERATYTVVPGEDDRISLIIDTECYPSRICD